MISPTEGELTSRRAMHRSARTALHHSTKLHSPPYKVRVDRIRKDARKTESNLVLSIYRIAWKSTKYIQFSYRILAEKLSVRNFYVSVLVSSLLPQAQAWVFGRITRNACFA